MKTGLVLSGGGAKGIFQAAVLSVMFEKGFKFDIVSGVSVGALNGALIATGQQDKITEIWHNTREGDVYKKKSIFKIARQFALHKIGIGKAPRSLYSNDPLRKLMKKHLIGANIQIPFYAGKVNLESGEYVSSMQKYKNGGIVFEDFVKDVIASTAIPVIWEPEEIGGDHYVDGGVRNISPISEVIAHNVDRMVIITTEPLGSNPAGYAKDLFDIAGRSINIMLDEIFHEDIKRFLDINDFVRQAGLGGIGLTKNGKDMKYIDTILIQPTTGLGDALNFDKNIQNERWNIGLNVAKQRFSL